MKHFYKREEMHDATRVVGNIWAGEHSKIPGDTSGEIRYKKTRSTLAVEVSDIFDLEDEYAVLAFKNLIRLCISVGRDEIVVENLENVAMGEEHSICDCFNSLQATITRTCRSMNLYPARVSLEKRGQHYDLRIYPSFH